MHSAGPWRVRRLHGGCVRSLCRNPDQKRPVVCFDESPIPTHRRACADRPRPTPVSSSTTIASTSATAPSVCSYSSTRAPALGARSTSPTAAPRSASPPVCATLADGRFSKAERIRAVLDNMSTHSVGALYQALLPAEAHRLLCWLQFHYVPKHASWLSMVEIEIGVLRSQCLDRRIQCTQRILSEVAAWERQRNASRARACLQLRKLAPKHGAYASQSSAKEA